MVAGVALLPTSALAIPTTFAQVSQTSSTPQFSILNSGSTTTVSASGQDFFTFLVGGTPFGSPVLANFTLNASSTQSGTCGTSGCPNGDAFTQQGYTGSFSYTVATGIYSGMTLLGGTFGVNATPANSGGTLSENVNGTGGSYLSTQSSGNPTAIVMSSDFLNFSGVSVEAGSWGFSGLSPNFALNAPVGNVSTPQTGTRFTAAAVATFSSEPPPVPNNTPEPASMVLMGSALVGLSMIGRKKFRK